MENRKHATLSLFKKAICFGMLFAVFGLAVGQGEIIKDVSFEKVSLRDDFWRPWQEKQAEVTIPAALKNTQEAVDNLKIAGDMTQGRPHGQAKPLVRFISSDLYKAMESAAYSLMIAPNPALEKRLDEIIDIIGDAQQPDGYLFVPHICKFSVGGIGKTPYSEVLLSHELYNVGHMYEGAVAYWRATGKDKWLKISEKNARHIEKVFFEGDSRYNGGKPVMEASGHEEIELALCKLSAATEDPFYLEEARKFLDIRGNNAFALSEGKAVKGSPKWLSLSYSQQHEPVAEQREAVGHSVRAMYLYTGMAAVDALSGSSAYNTALEAIWNNIVSTRMHITGGLGAIQAIEGFGREYYLPNKTTYNETCAAVANVFFNHKMFLRTREAKYLDILELSLFNGALSGIGIEGDTFFYVNPLEADGVSYFNQGAKERSKWLSCACCPPNISRLLMQASGFVYSHDGAKNIWVGLYASSEAEFDFGGQPIKISQVSDYPFGGKTSFSVQAGYPKKFALRLRIPTWADGGDGFVPGGLYKFAYPAREKPTLKVNGESVPLNIEKGFAVLEREWSNGDRVELNLPMPVRMVVCNSQVAANVGRAAFTRGPFVFCAEEPDNGVVQKIYVSANRDTLKNAAFDKFQGGALKGIGYITIPCGKIGESEPTTALLIPYFAWNNRGGLSMSVWLPTSEDLAKNASASSSNPSAKYIEKISSSDENPVCEALFDGMIPASSSQLDVPAWLMGKKTDKNGEAWVEAKLKQPMTLNSAGVYFGLRPNIDVPQSWRVQYSLEGSPFKDMKLYMTDVYATQLDKFNVAHPASPVRCDAVRFVFKKGKRWSLISEAQMELVP